MGLVYKRKDCPLEHIATNAAFTPYLLDETFWTQIRTQTVFITNCLY